MKKLVKIFENTYNKNDDFVRQMESYSRVLNTEDWKFLVNAISLIKMEMSYDMFSEKYTNMSERQKDVLQKTYYQTMLILEFLGNPKRWISKRMEYKKKLADLAKKNSKQRGGTTW